MMMISCHGDNLYRGLWLFGNREPGKSVLTTLTTMMIVGKMVTMVWSDSETFEKKLKTFRINNSCYLNQVFENVFRKCFQEGENSFSWIGALCFDDIDFTFLNKFIDQTVSETVWTKKGWTEGQQLLSPIRLMTFGYGIDNDLRGLHLDSIRQVK